MPVVVYGIDTSMDEAGELSGMEAVSPASELADAAITALPRACADTLAEPPGDPAALADAVSTDDSAEGGGVHTVPKLIGSGIVVCSPSDDPTSPRGPAMIGEVVGPSHCDDVTVNVVRGTTVDVPAADADDGGSAAANGRSASDRATAPSAPTALFRRVQEGQETDITSYLVPVCPQGRCGLRPRRKRHG
jgi:hypothetical protein